MKKLFAITLVLAMVLMLGSTALAAEANLSGHEFTAYQIFSGTQAAGEDASSALGSIAWGSGINGAAFLEALQGSSAFGGTNPFSACQTAKDVSEAMASWQDDSANARAFADLAFEYKSGTGISVEAGSTTLDAGYYLVVDTTTPAEDEENFVYNLALLQLTKKGTFDIETKVDIPIVVKKVKDINDSIAGSETDWQDSADYDIGDIVSFQLKATLGTIADYDTYKVIFHDRLSDGLTYNGDAKVYVGNTEVTSNFSIDPNAAAANGGGTLTVSCPNVKAFATDGSVITVLYTATLNANAKIGAEGNPNTVKLEYSNNPNVSGSGENHPTGETPQDKVIVFTFLLNADKVDPENQPLPGAGFTLYKFIPSQDGEDTYGEGDLAVAGTWTIVGAEVSGTAMTNFSWKGLDDGIYKIVETTIPSGYNPMEDQIFLIEAQHDAEEDDPKLTQLTTTLTGFTATTSTGIIDGDIMNQAGTILPETGGRGVYVVYILGALLLGGAVVLLFIKRTNS